MSFILLISSFVVPVPVAVCLWSGAPSLCHHMVCDLCRSLIPISGSNNRVASNCIIFYNLYSLFFFLFQPDILPLRTVLHQQSICSSLPSCRSCSHARQGCQQRQKEELIHLLGTTCIQLISQYYPGAHGHSNMVVANFVISKIHNHCFFSQPWEIILET